MFESRHAVNEHGNPAKPCEDCPIATLARALAREESERAVSGDISLITRLTVMNATNVAGASDDYGDKAERLASGDYTLAYSCNNPKSSFVRLFTRHNRTYCDAVVAPIETTEPDNT